MLFRPASSTFTTKTAVSSNSHSSTTRMPKQNYTCQHCGHKAEGKADKWQHIRMHVKPEKLLACDSCQFVTEYKHHLEYHKRNHEGYKPFKCESCDYKCVNKSMLKSHMKSHSSSYPYECGECKYATKYPHSLKTHQKKYSHQKSSPIMIDVYCSDTNKIKRGPSSATSSVSSVSQDQQCILDLRIDSKLIQ